MPSWGGGQRRRNYMHDVSDSSTVLLPSRPTARPPLTSASLVSPGALALALLFHLSGIAQFGDVASVVSTVVGLIVPPIDIVVARRRAAREGREHEAEFRRQLAERRQELSEQRADKERELRAARPGPVDCLALVEDQTAIWRWSRQKPGYLDLRLGVGNAPFKPPPDEALAQLDPSDPLCAEALKLAEDFAWCHDVPMGASFAVPEYIGITGSREAVRNAVRSGAIQLATHYQPSEVKLAAIYPAAESDQWGCDGCPTYGPTISRVAFSPLTLKAPRACSKG